MKPIFTPEDFLPLPPIFPKLLERSRAVETANIANAKLEKLMETWPVVYGIAGGLDQLWDNVHGPWDTHTARLAFIEELPKKKCVHEPEPMAKVCAKGLECRHCGVELVAKWEER